MSCIPGADCDAEPKGRRECWNQIAEQQNVSEEIGEHTIGGNFDAFTHILACSALLTCGTIIACAPESKQREIHSEAQVGTTTMGVMLHIH